MTSSGDYSYDRVETIHPILDELLQYAGRCYYPELDVYWTLLAANDHLVTRLRKCADSQLTPLFSGTLIDDGRSLMGYPTT